MKITRTYPSKMLCLIPALSYEVPKSHDNYDIYPPVAFNFWVFPIITPPQLSRCIQFAPQLTCYMITISNFRVFPIIPIELCVTHSWLSDLLLSKRNAHYKTKGAKKQTSLDKSNSSIQPDKLHK